MHGKRRDCGGDIPSFEVPSYLTAHDSINSPKYTLLFKKETGKVEREEGKLKVKLSESFANLRTNFEVIQKGKQVGSCQRNHF